TKIAIIIFLLHKIALPRRQVVHQSASREDQMREIHRLAAASVVLCLAAALPARADVEYRAAVLRVDAQGTAPISRLDLKPDDLGFAGAELGTADNATTGGFMGQSFTTETVAATPDTAEEELSRLLDEGFSYIVLLADA